MSRRFLELIGVAAVLMVVLVFLNLPLVRVAGQAPTATPKAGPAPKTLWGEPDLQGIWTDEYETPLQRPAQYANKEFFTDAERVDLDKKRAAVLRRDARSEKGTEADVAGAYNATFISVKHTGRRTSLVVDPPDGKIPALTPEAIKRAAVQREFVLALLQATQTCKNHGPECAGGQYGPVSPRRAEPTPYYNTGRLNREDDPEDRNISERCMSAVLPDFGGYRRIVQSPGSVAIFYDVGQGQGWQRVIPVTANPHLPPFIRQWWGDSRGRWEGDTLVVDVTNFNAKADFRGSRETLHLVERWTRVDANTIAYAVTIDDPTTWTKPWTVKQEMTRQHDQANRFYTEPRCHEGNFGLTAMLSGGRADDKAFAEGRGPNPATKDTTKLVFGDSDQADDPLADPNPTLVQPKVQPTAP